MAKSPVAIPFSTDGVEIPVKDATAVPTDARGFIGVGLDGSTTRFIRVDSSGRQVFVGGGIAGTPAGGVVSVQGVAGGTALPISVASLPLPTGAATEATLATRATEATLLLVKAKTDNLDVALSTRATEATLATRLTEATFIARINTLGQKAAAASTPVVIASDQTAIPVSQSGTWTVQQGTPPWSVTVPAPLTTTGGGTEATALRVTIANDSTGLLSVDDNGGSLTVDTPQLPAALVGGRLDVVVGAALPAGTNNIGDVDVLSVPAPLSTTGGGTEAAALRVTIAKDSTGLVSVDDNGGSLTVDTPQLPAALVGGRLDGNVGAWLGATTPTVGQKTMAASLPVVLASDQTSINVKLNSSTGTVTQVASSATNVTLLASNAARRGATIFNDSNKTLYVKLGATASATSYTKQLGTDEYWEIPFGYTGVINGIWALANGNAYVTELT